MMLTPFLEQWIITHVKLKVLHNHGDVIRELTDEEYERHEAYVFRGFSGHWLVFYSLGMSLIYSSMKKRENNQAEALS